MLMSFFTIIFVQIPGLVLGRRLYYRRELAGANYYLEPQKTGARYDILKFLGCKAPLTPMPT